jgi:hypothetical protein
MLPVPESAASDGLQAPPQDPLRESTNSSEVHEHPTDAVRAVAEARSIREDRLDQMQQRARDERWEEQYATLTPGELLAQRDALEKAIYESSREFFEAQFSAGNAVEFDPNDPELIELRQNPFLITWLRSEPGSRTEQRVVLPESSFPELYRMRELSTFLALTAHLRESVGLPTVGR